MKPVRAEIGTILAEGQVVAATGSGGTQTKRVGAHQQLIADLGIGGESSPSHAMPDAQWERSRRLALLASVTDHTEIVACFIATDGLALSQLQSEARMAGIELNINRLGLKRALHEVVAEDVAIEGCYHDPTMRVQEALVRAEIVEPADADMLDELVAERAEIVLSDDLREMAEAEASGRIRRMRDLEGDARFHAAVVRSARIRLTKRNRLLSTWSCEQRARTHPRSSHRRRARRGRGQRTASRSDGGGDGGGDPEPLDPSHEGSPDSCARRRRTNRAERRPQ